jgi:hypothetical protein
MDQETGVETGMSISSHGIMRRNDWSSIGCLTTRHVLEDLEKLLNGDVLETGRTLFIINSALEFAKNTREGFDFLASKESKETLLWERPALYSAQYATHLEKHLGDKKKAERFARALEKALVSYQDAVAAYDTPRFIFSSEEVRREVSTIINKLIRDCNLFLYAFPDRDGPSIVVKY